jgi:hypothetical protein
VRRREIDQNLGSSKTRKHGSKTLYKIQAPSDEFGATVSSMQEVSDVG